MDIRVLIVLLVVGLILWSTLEQQPYPPPSVVEIKPLNMDSAELSYIVPPKEIRFGVTTAQQRYPQLRVERWEWKLYKQLSKGAETGTEVAASNEEEFVYEFKEPGIYKLSVTVSNNAGWSATGSIFIYVYPTKKCSIENLDLAPNNDYPPLRTYVSFIPRHPELPENYPLRCTIDWGDGTEPWVAGTSEVKVNGEVRRAHEYQAPGEYEVRVAVWVDWAERETRIIQSKKLVVKPQKNYMMPAWSPDMDKIAVVFRDDARPNAYIIGYFSGVRDLLEGRKDTLQWSEVYSRAGAELLFPYWIDANNIIFSGNLTARSFDIYRVDLQGTLFTLTYTDYRDELFPTYFVSPIEKGETFILFSGGVPPYSETQKEQVLGTRSSGGGYVAVIGKYDELQVYKLNLKAGETKLTLTRYPSTYPIYWKEDRYLFVRQNRLMSGSLQAAETAIRDETTKALAYSPFYLRPNPVNPDYIAFMAEDQGEWRVFMRTPDGGVIPVGTGYYPSWSPDGQYLVMQTWLKSGWTFTFFKVMERTGKADLKLLQPFQLIYTYKIE